MKLLPTPVVRLAAFAVLCLIGNAWALDGVPYLDTDGEMRAADDVAVIDANGGARTLNEGWYIVRGAFTNNGTITIDGTVNLILEDGSDLVVTGSYNNAGINVSNSNSLSIYAQSTGDSMGKLAATGGSYGAGIGGGREGGGGTVTITGGTVTATGGSSGAGIGGSGSTVTITGGTVTATGGIYGSTVTITGGTVTATVIGGYGGGSGSTVTITGGTVTASGNYYGIYGSTVTISGGTVTATGGSYGISGNTVTISGGTVTATGGTGYNAAGIGGGSGTFTLDGNAVVFASSINAWSDRILKNGILFIFDIGTATILEGTPVTEHFPAEGMTAAWKNQDGKSGIAYESGNEAGFIEVPSVIVIERIFINNVSYIDTNGEKQIANNVIVLGEDNIAAIDHLNGWFLVRGNNLTRSATLRILGEAHIILEDGSDLAVRGSSDNAGINVSEGNSLAIYAQSTGNSMGKLAATGDYYGDGIGDGRSSYGGSGGTVTISGGTVTATDGGIRRGIGGTTVTITGGTVTATGGTGIGGDGSTVTITGGTVTATGGIYGTVTITGGTVTATVIGGYGGGSGSTVTITGGTVTATGSIYGTVTITGGTVTATGVIGGYSYTFTLDGNAVVLASSVSENRTLKSGILFIFNIGTATILEGTPVTKHFPAEGMTAAWKNQGGKSGIAYESGNETGFIEVTGVTLIERIFINNVPYIDTNGTTQIADNVIVLDEDNISAIDNLNGWFLVRGNNLTRNATLRISGEAHIILENGSDLAVTGRSSAGINVSEGSSLAIYAQSTGNSMGKLAATGGYDYDAGIGGGAVIIAGGAVTATGGRYGTGISGSTVTISGGTVTATEGSDSGYGIDGTVTITGGTVTAIGGIAYGTFTLDGNAVVFTSSIGATGENRMLKNGILFIVGIGTGTIFNGTSVAANFSSKEVTAAWESRDGKSGIAYASGSNEGFIEFPSVTLIERDLIDNVPYIDEKGVEQIANDVVVLDENNIAAIDNLSGWFLVRGNLTRDATLLISGEAHIILEDGSDLAVKGSNAGINVSEGKSLTIYAQSIDEDDMGKLTATGSGYGPGIGGGDNVDYWYSGTVTITGGTVTATGGRGAGIGGSGGTVTITGGTVTATGGSSYYGIGGSGGTVTISGGTVTATGSSSYYGIGGSGGTVTISGGTVTGGIGGSGGTVTISGGTVTGGIGGGTVTITGGTVTATSSYGIYGSTFTVTLDGNAVVFASSVNATNRILKSGILFIGNIGKVYGSVELQENLEVESGYTLTISENATLTIPSEITLTNNGKITPANGSTITINGTVNGENKIDGANTLPSATTKTLTSITLGGTADLLATTGQEIEYAINQTNNAPADGWQTETTFAGLTEKTTYWIFARSKENTHFAAGTASAGLQVSTKATPALANLRFTIPRHIYNGEAQGIGNVTGTSGIGTITVYYNGSPDKPANAGKYIVTADIAESTEFVEAEGIVLGEYSITAKSITITGITAASKEYDGNATATVTGTATINGAIEGDNITVINGTASFANKNVGTDKTVAFSGFSLSGTDANNYTLAQPASTTANITAKPVTITGITAASKEYDGSTTATVTGTETINGTIEGDNVTVINGTALFADKNIGTGKTVTFSEFSLGGTDARNYTITVQPASTTANITAKPVTITGITVHNKEYDGTATATVTGTAAISGAIEGDNITVINGTASFADRNVGTNKLVTFIGFRLIGLDADNYALIAQPASVTADITSQSSPILSHKTAKGNLLTPTQNGITLTAKTNTTVAVYNLSGKLISRQNYNAGSHSISLGHLPKGIYIVKAAFGSEKQILRVMVR